MSKATVDRVRLAGFLRVLRALGLEHKDATVTRQSCVREVADARRRQMRRTRMLQEYKELIEVRSTRDVWVIQAVVFLFLSPVDYDDCFESIRDGKARPLFRVCMQL